MKIAAAAYPIDWHDSWDSYAGKLSRWVAEAAGAQAELLVFPEYGAMELASLAGPVAAGDLAGCRQAVSDRMPRLDGLLARLARQYGVHILGPSGPVIDGERPVNRATFVGPDGRGAVQDKQIMTRFERETWGICPGGPLHVFDTAIGKIGVLICYDAEFPALARTLIEAGVETLLVPSCTEALAGHMRVRIGAMARALEGQCVAVHAVTQGPAPWCPVVDDNTGAAGIYGPPDLGFPEDGVLARGPLERPGWVYADVAGGAVAGVRKDGHVLNHAHWGEQTERGKSARLAEFQAIKLENAPE